MTTHLGFHGAARTVTGSRYLLATQHDRVLVDCGLFQGLKELRELNWRPPPFAASSVDRALITHAHIDHIGALPRLVRNGFDGPIHCTPATAELARLLLLDSAKIQEEDARWANQKGHSKHDPALPLYTESDAKRALRLFEPVEPGEWLDVGSGLRARWAAAGHILGSCHLEVRRKRSQGESAILFSGDIGRYGVPLHRDPSPRPPADIVICESTYGDRLHDLEVPVAEQLRRLLAPTLEADGTVLVPAFAVGRSQQLTLILRRLMDAGELQEVPIHLDSPMAVDATSIYGRYLDEHHLDADVFEDGRRRLFPRNVQLCRSTADSIALNDLPGPRIIVSASGMLSGGRVLHHLKRLAPGRENLIALVGYQAPGTRGRRLLQGERFVRVHGRDVPVRARCASISGLSAHGDRSELLRWLSSEERPPNVVFLTHGEPEAAFSLAGAVKELFGCPVHVPELDETVDLGPFL